MRALSSSLILNSQFSKVQVSPKDLHDMREKATFNIRLTQENPRNLGTYTSTRQNLSSLHCASIDSFGIHAQKHFFKKDKKEMIKRLSEKNLLPSQMESCQKKEIIRKALRKELKSGRNQEKESFSIVALEDIEHLKTVAKFALNGLKDPEIRYTKEVEDIIEQRINLYAGLLVGKNLKVAVLDDIFWFYANFLNPLEITKFSSLLFRSLQDLQHFSIQNFYIESIKALEKSKKLLEIYENSANLPEIPQSIIPKIACIDSGINTDSLLPFKINDQIPYKFYENISKRVAKMEPNIADAHYLGAKNLSIAHLSQILYAGLNLPRRELPLSESSSEPIVPQI